MGNTDTVDDELVSHFRGMLERALVARNANVSDAREAIYSNAREALDRHLKSQVDASDIAAGAEVARHLDALELAISRIEEEFNKAEREILRDQRNSDNQNPDNAAENAKASPDPQAAIRDEDRQLKSKSEKPAIELSEGVEPNNEKKPQAAVKSGRDSSVNPDENKASEANNNDNLNNSINKNDYFDINAKQKNDKSSSLYENSPSKHTDKQIKDSHKSHDDDSTLGFDKSQSSKSDGDATALKKEKTQPAGNQKKKSKPLTDKDIAKKSPESPENDENKKDNKASNSNNNKLSEKETEIDSSDENNETDIRGNLADSKPNPKQPETSSDSVSIFDGAPEINDDVVQAESGVASSRYPLSRMAIAGVGLVLATMAIAFFVAGDPRYWGVDRRLAQTDVLSNEITDAGVHELFEGEQIGSMPDPIATIGDLTGRREIVGSMSQVAEGDSQALVHFDELSLSLIFDVRRDTAPQRETRDIIHVEIGQTPEPIFSFGAPILAFPNASGMSGIDSVPVRLGMRRLAIGLMQPIRPMLDDEEASFAVFTFPIRFESGERVEVSVPFASSLFFDPSAIPGPIDQ